MYTNVRVIALSGKQGSGKTTMQKMLGHLLGAYGRQVHPMNFADPLRDMHNELRGYMERMGCPPPPEVAVKDGLLMQLLGTDWARKVYGANVWVQILKMRAAMVGTLCANPELPIYIIVGDMRFMNEFYAFPDTQFPEAYKIRLECSAEQRKGRAENWRENTAHPSETGLDDPKLAPFDVIVDTETNGPAAALEIVVEGLKKRWGNL